MLRVMFIIFLISVSSLYSQDLELLLDLEVSTEEPAGTQKILDIVLKKLKQKKIKARTHSQQSSLKNQVMVSLKASTLGVVYPDTEAKTWIAIIACKAKMGKRPLWNFLVRSSKTTVPAVYAKGMKDENARLKALEKLAEFVATKIVSRTHLWLRLNAYSSGFQKYKWAISKERGSSRTLAIDNASRAAVFRHTRTLIDPDLFSRREKRIYFFIQKNWRKYIKGKPIVAEKYKFFQIKIKIRINQQKLLNEVLALVAPTKAIRGLQLVVLVDENGSHEEEAGKDLLSTVQDVLLENGAICYIEPEAEEIPEVKHLVYIAAVTEVKDRTSPKLWWAEIKGYCIDKESDEFLWEIAMESGIRSARPVSAEMIGEKQARMQAVRGLAKLAAYKITAFLSRKK